jgi:hypothetical protein
VLRQATHRISVFTEGILAMETTLLGVIEVRCWALTLLDVHVVVRHGRVCRSIRGKS